jgi:hypothetical protein
VTAAAFLCFGEDLDASDALAGCVSRGLPGAATRARPRVAEGPTMGRGPPRCAGYWTGGVGRRRLGLRATRELAAVGT